MGLISRVSSRTYRETVKKKLTFAILKRASALTARITRRRLHNIPKEKIEGDYQVWIGYLRKPPPAVTGFDIPGWAPYPAGLVSPSSCGSGLPDQSSRTENFDEKLEADTSTHNSKSPSAKLNKNDETSFKLSLMNTTRMTKKRTTNKLFL